MKQLSEDRIQEMRKVRDGVISTYGERNTMLKRYEEIYFMSRGESPNGLKGTDPKDIKETISSSGRDAVTGLKRILDSGEVHVKVKGAGNSDKIEAGLKKMLEVSGEYRIASVEKDLNLSASLYGPSVMTVELVDDLIETQTNPMDADLPKYKNEYVAAQLQMLKKKTPFLMHTVTPPQSYPMWGAWGMIGHVRKYTMKGAEITDRWGVNCDPSKDFDITDFFYYTDRLVEATGISDPLMAVEWVTRDPKTGEMIGSINIPVFARYSGGTSLFHEPEKQSQPLLYAKAKGNWDLRENLYFTVLFTSLYQQGLPGPLLLVDPENSNQDIEVEYRMGFRYVVAKGQMQNTQVINGDVLQMNAILEKQAATQTVQPQTLGQNTGGVTFSQFALASKAGLIPAIDPKESQEALYRDVFTHILQRIKEEDIANDLIAPADIPEKFELEVSIEPDLEQDDLRNAQIAVQLKNAQVGSREWIETNILKIPNSADMWKERKLEELMDTMVEMMKTPEMMQQYLMTAMGNGKGAAGGPTGRLRSGQGAAGGEVAPGGAVNSGLPAGGGAMPMMPGMEQMPQTDAMIPPEERQ